MKKEFDYYIFVDYSESLIGYIIIEERCKNLLFKKILAFRHFKELKHKRTYLLKIKRIIKKGDLFSLVYKQKITSVRDSLEIFTEIVAFVRENDNKQMFISVDNKHYTSFKRLFYELFSNKNLVIIAESQLRQNSSEYKLSLIIDNLLNIERLGKETLPFY